MVGTNAEKSPNSPLLQRGRAVGPGDFCADRNFHKSFMRLRSPTEIERWDSSTDSSRNVIPAHAGIQIVFANQWAWIPAFAGMTDLDDPSLVRPLIHNGYFRKRHGDTEFGKELGEFTAETRSTQSFENMSQTVLATTLHGRIG